MCLKSSDSTTIIMPNDSEEKLVPEGAPASVTDHLPRQKLPKDLQKLSDKDDDFFDGLYDGQYEACPLRL